MYGNDLLPYVVPLDVVSEPLVCGDRSTPVLDAVLTSDAAGKAFVCAVANKHPEQAVRLTLDFKGMGLKAPRKVHARVLAGRSADDYNDIGDEHVRPVDVDLPVKDGAVAIPAHSVTFLFLQ